MLGRSIGDPSGIESPIREAVGLGLIQATTELTREKRTRAVTATTPRGVKFGGYEIHLGVTSLDSYDEKASFARLGDGSVDGDVVVTEGSFFVRAERERLGLRSPATAPSATPSRAPGATSREDADAAVQNVKIIVNEQGY